MRVVQLIGPYAGKVVEMNYAAAENCIAAGTACRIGDVHNHRVKGLDASRFDKEALTGQSELDLSAKEPEKPKAKAGPKVRAGSRRKRKS